MLWSIPNAIASISPCPGPSMPILGASMVWEQPLASTAGRTEGARLSGPVLMGLEHRKGGDPQHFYVQRRKARNRVSASVKSTPPMTSNAKNCGQTTLNPAPRNRIACDSMTKWVVGAPSMMF